MARAPGPRTESRRVTLGPDEHHSFLMLFTGDSLPDPARRRRALWMIRADHLCAQRAAARRRTA